MQAFGTIEDVQDWLQPMGYEAFWQAALMHDLLGPEDRAHCDATLAKGVADYDTVLTVMKAVARDALVERHGLVYSTTLAPKPALQIVH